MTGRSASAANAGNGVGAVTKEVEICEACLVATGFEPFGFSVSGDEQMPCAICGNLFWVLTLAYAPVLDVQAMELAL